LIVYFSLDSHHPRTGCYPLVVASSLVFQKLTMVNPLLSILEKCKKINSMKHPTFLTYPTLTSTFSTITMQHKRLEPFNRLLLKSHTKYVHLSSFFLSLSKESFTYPHTTFSYHFLVLLHNLNPPSPHTTYKAHIDL
jgi:hypothetical protein